MAWYEHLLGVLSIIFCFLFATAGLTAVAACVLSSRISRAEEERKKHNRKFVIEKEYNE